MEINPLAAKVQGLSLGGLELLIKSLLAREGFGEIAILNRWKPTQKTDKGGFELACYRGSGPLEETILVKVIRNEDIRVRSIAEMAGNVDRMKADRGIVLTTKRACHTTLRELPKITKSPIKIMEIHDIVQLMIDHKIGVRPHGEPSHQYFVLLDELAKDAEECHANNQRKGRG